VSYSYWGAVVARRATTEVYFLDFFIWGVGRGAVVRSASDYQNSYSHTEITDCARLSVHQKI